MAQFPTAVKSFTTRNAGDVIQPAHVNEMQDEINAIEGGILNGTAGITCSNLTVLGSAVGVTSSNSTFANISCTGGSTLNTLNVTGGSTLEALTVRGAFKLAVSLNSTFTGEVNDFSIASSVAVLRIQSSVASTLTGFSFVGGNSGRWFTVMNPGAPNVVLATLTGSLSSNQIVTAGLSSVVIRGNGSVLIVYDDNQSVWRVSGA